MKQSFQPETANPYAPPQDVPPQYADPGGTAQGNALRPVGTGGPWIRWVLLTSYVCAILSFGVGAILIQPDATGRVPNWGLLGLGIAEMLMIIGVLCAMTYGALIFVWVGLSWAMIPPPGRRTESGRAISPALAVGLLFIPLFNLYWVFVQSRGLCDALNRQLGSLGVTRRAPRGLAMAASIVQVLPYVNITVGPLLWLTYIFFVDAAKDEYRRASSS
jgi:hypothetical protein